MKYGMESESRAPHALRRAPVVTLLAVLCTMLWGSAFPLLKISFVELSIDSPGEIYDFIAYRFIIAGLLMALLIKMKGEGLGLSDGRSWGFVTLIALVQVCLQFVFFYIGLMNTTGVKASIINGSGTFFMLILSQVFVAAENVSVKKWMGAMAGFAGLVAVNFNASLSEFSFSLMGDGMILLTAPTGAFGSLLVKRASVFVSPLHINMYQFIIGSALLLAVSHATGSAHLAPSAFQSWNLGVLLYLGASTAMAFALWYTLIQMNNLSRVAVFFFLVPVWGALFSTLLVPGETLGVMTVLGGGLVSGGIYLTMRD